MLYFIKLNDSDIQFKRCTSANLADICFLQDLAFSHLNNEDLLRKNSIKTLQICLNDPHYTLGAWYGNQLIAFAILYDAGKTEENLGYDIDIKKEDLNDVINMKLIIVSPFFRGNGLQTKLTTKLEEIAKIKGKKIVCLTISPENIYSQKNAIALNYQLYKTKVKYNNLKRNIYYKLL